MEEQQEKEQKTFLKFDSPTEEKLIVGYLYKDRSTFLKLSKYLRTNHWNKNSYFQDSKLQLIMNICCQFEEKYQRLPSAEVVNSMIEKSGADDFLQNQAKTLFKNLKAADYNQYPDQYIKDIAVDFIRRERAVEATYANQADIEAGDYSKLSKRMQDAVNVNLDKDLGLSLKDVAASLGTVKTVKDDSLGCTWGSPRLDNILGKIMPGEIGVICGVPGAGKTAWLGHFGIANFLLKKNVVMFSFEVNEQRLTTRFYKTLFNLKTKDLLNLKEEDADKFMKSPEVGDIRIVNRQANSCSSDDMAGIINDLIAYENFKPDLILVDYILITSANNKKINSSDGSYKYYKTVTEELRNLGMEFKVPVITAAQINREGMGDQGGSKQVITGKDLSESRGIIDTADTILMIEQTGKEKVTEKDQDGTALKGHYRIRIDKNRNGDVHDTVNFDINWKTMKITESKKLAS